MTATSSDQIAIETLGRLDSSDRARAGGKGANLGRLTAEGFAVPPGFVVLAGAYEAFRSQTHLDRRLHELLDGLDIDDPDDLQATAGQAAAAVVATSMPEWLAAAIGGAYRDLVAPATDGAVAVRSSTTAEDTASASFARMNQSVLNVNGAEGCVNAVKRCWSLQFGARRLYFGAQCGLDLPDMPIAVVVQRQIASARSGVMFTSDPASGDRGRLVIEGAFGLGVSVVLGQVSPDRYVVDKSGCAIVERSVRRKELTIEATAGGGTQTRALHADDGSRAVLSDGDVLALAEIGIRIERTFGAPQDIEWALDGNGTIWMLQSRPLTTLS